jgi:Transposase and inactivated derivatives
MIKREKIELVKGSDIYAGIDVASDIHRVRFIDNLGQEVIKGISFSNDREGFRELEEHMKKFGIDHNIIFGLEPTGDYWKPIGYYLRRKGYKVVLVNPYHIKRTKEIIDNSQQKDDRKDSYLIADLVKQGKYFFPIIPEGIYGEMRELSISWKRTKQQITRLKCYLSNFLAKYFPEYKSIFSDILGKSSFYILSHYPLPEDIKRIGKKRLTKIIKRISKGKIREEKIDRLYERARDTVGIKEGREAAKMFLKEVLKELERLMGRRKKIKEKMKELLKISGYGDYLLSIKGVGVVSACLFLGDIGNPRRYKRASQIEKLAGYNLVEESSGKKKGEKQISKRGRKTLRYVGYLVANVAIAKNKEIRELYRYKVDVLKRNRIKVMVGIAAKMGIL